MNFPASGFTQTLKVFCFPGNWVKVVELERGLAAWDVESRWGLTAAPRPFSALLFVLHEGEKGSQAQQ